MRSTLIRRASMVAADLAQRRRARTGLIVAAAALIKPCSRYHVPLG